MVEKNLENEVEKTDLTKEWEKEWETISITHFYMFANVFRKEAVVRAFLTPLLGESVDSVLFRRIDPEGDGLDSDIPEMRVNIEADKTVLEYLTKSARFDIFVKAEAFACDIEMQAYKKEEEPLNKRARAYQRAIDQELIRSGMHYKDIIPSYIIFICTEDPFDKGLGQYMFENVDAGNQCLRLNDGTQKIFLYTKGKCDNVHPEIADFLHYCNGRQPTGILATLVDQSVQSIKNDAKHRESFMTLKSILEGEYKEGFKDGHDKGLEEGHNQGLELGQKNSIVSLLKKGKSVPEIVFLLDFPEEYVEGVVKSFKPAQA